MSRTLLFRSSRLGEEKEMQYFFCWLSWSNLILSVIFFPWFFKDVWWPVVPPAFRNGTEHREQEWSVGGHLKSSSCSMRGGSCTVPRMHKHLSQLRTAAGHETSGFPCWTCDVWVSLLYYHSRFAPCPVFLCASPDRLTFNTSCLCKFSSSFFTPKCSKLLPEEHSLVLFITQRGTAWEDPALPVLQGRRMWARSLFKGVCESTNRHPSHLLRGLINHN